jgi:octaprenyl-diphosphate synthase
MPSIDQIKAPIKQEMESFEKKFQASMKSSVPLLDRITHYIVKRKGKQMRPMFVFFSAGMCGGIGEATYVGASLIELLHTATLVHDDVVDDSYERRGFFSVNALWKNKIAVLVGDYLLSKGLLLSVKNNQYKLLQIVSEAVEMMSEGELLQIEKARKLDIEEPVYFEIIRQKTASLIASCCACGAASAGADDETVAKMKQFGEMVGIAFQIKDDMFDYNTGNNIGKPIGIDIKEKKLTLPLIHTLNTIPQKEKRKLINIIKNHNTDKKKVAEVIDYVVANEGITYATEKMNEFQAKAFEILDTFADSRYKEGLRQLVTFTTERQQ